MSSSGYASERADLRKGREEWENERKNSPTASKVSAECSRERETAEGL